MSTYSEKLCDALIVVLDHCGRMEPRRLAGYVANIDFWVDEIRHRLSLCDGLIDRRRRMVAGTQQFYEAEIERSAAAQIHNIQSVVERSVVEPDVRDVSTDWETLKKQSDQMRERIAVSAKVFFRRCRKANLITAGKLADIEVQLGIRIGSK